MLTLKGTLRAIVDAPATTNKKTGEVYPASTVLQIETTGKSRGVEKIELHNITVADASKWRPLVTKAVEVPVRAYAPGARVTLAHAE